MFCNVDRSWRGRLLNSMRTREKQEREHESEFENKDTLIPRCVLLHDGSQLMYSKVIRLFGTKNLE